MGGGEARRGAPRTCEGVAPETGAPRRVGPQPPGRGQRAARGAPAAAPSLLSFRIREYGGVVWTGQRFSNCRGIFEEFGLCVCARTDFVWRMKV